MPKRQTMVSRSEPRPGIEPQVPGDRVKRRTTEMFNDWHYRVTQDSHIRAQDHAERVAERNRYRRRTGTLSLRARMARRLFALAVATEREETWRVVWERLEARGRL